MHPAAGSRRRRRGHRNHDGLLSGLQRHHRRRRQLHFHGLSHGVGDAARNVNARRRSGLGRKRPGQDASHRRLRLGDAAGHRDEGELARRPRRRRLRLRRPQQAQRARRDASESRARRDTAAVDRDPLEGVPVVVRVLPAGVALANGEPCAVGGPASVGDALALVGQGGQPEGFEQMVRHHVVQGAEIPHIVLLPVRDAGIVRAPLRLCQDVQGERRPLLGHGLRNFY
mmetsp:Transcript_110277/g.355656  ORF Transcript_110277/g.355656 Transcript_110277/m.355656 type:complete len:228 (+) Transcript_110277:1497-2180(+)